MRKLLILLVLTATCWAQKKNIALEDIWARPTFSQKSVASVNWMKDGSYYTALEGGKVIKNSITTGQKVETIFDPEQNKINGASIVVEDYSLSADENKLLLLTETKPIYRHSFTAQYYIYDRATKSLKKLSDKGAQSYASFSADGTKVAFCRENNLHCLDLATNREWAITQNGKTNEWIHGSTDWVYEEEFSFAPAFFWSPDSKKIAFYSFNESKVPEYNMQLWGTLYPADYKYKYPKAGEPNSEVLVSIYSLEKNQTIGVDLGADKDIYIPRVMWTEDPETLSIRKLNRLQNHLQLLHANASTGQCTQILEEKSDTYIDVENADFLRYLKNGKGFIYGSESDGFKHLYQYDMKGKIVQQITKGNWDVADFYGLDEKQNKLYFTSTEVSPTERHLYCIGLNGKNKTKMDEVPGWNTANFSPDFQYHMIYHTASMKPYTVSLHKDSKTLKILEDNAALNAKLKDFNLSEKTFFQFKTSTNHELNGWMIKPQDFDASKQYPVLMFVYGGPGSQTVKNQWGGSDLFWYQMLASKGYIIVSVDNRGTGARGEAFKKTTYAQLGKLEVEDQIEAAKYLKTLPFVAKDRVGIWGWSFGGYMTSLCMTVGAEHFKTGIAVAPVTTWRYYDTIYTERFLKTPQLNPSGYDDNSPITHANKLKGKFLLVHGTGDDNVHYQNAVDFHNALIKAGKQFQSFYYPNRNHGIYGGNTRLHLYTMMTKFLEENL